jgi:DNA helicase HerA-like ATPase
VKLIRSKGIGIYFVTQNPLDIPESVLAQMGNRVQHALRAYTPREQKAVQTAASTFRPNPAFKTEEAITQLGKGEALVSVLDPKGVPTMVERTMVRPPSSRMGPITPEERQKIVKNSPVYGNYEQAEDRESAYEILLKRAEQRAAAAEQAKAEKAAEKEARSQPRASTRETATDRFVKNMASTAGRQIGNMIIRGILGGLTRK